MKEHNLKCCGCQINYVTKWKPKNNVWYCTKSCANKHNPRRHMEGKCHLCQSQISASRKYCNDCITKQRSDSKILSGIRKKNYSKLAVKSYIRKLKEKAIAYKGGKCQSCGYNRYNGSLQFHHVNATTKSFEISGKSISFERLKPELDKCVLVCSNCHGEIHGNVLDLKLVHPAGLEPT
jgi:hypothetical protein